MREGPHEAHGPQPLHPVMSATAILAVIATAVAFASVLIAVFSLREARRIRVTSERDLLWRQQLEGERQRTSIDITVDHRIGRSKAARSVNLNNPKHAPLVYELSIEVVNRGAQREFVTALLLTDGGGLDETNVSNALGITREPLPLEPRASQTAVVSIGRLGFDPTETGFRVIARLGSGALSASELQQLRPHLLAQLDK